MWGRPLTSGPLDRILWVLLVLDAVSIVAVCWMCWGSP